MAKDEKSKDTEARRIVRSMLVNTNTSMNDLLQKLNEKYPGYSLSLSNFSNKLTRGSIRFTEMLMIADVLGYTLEFKPTDGYDEADLPLGPEGQYNLWVQEAMEAEKPEEIENTVKNINETIEQADQTIKELEEATQKVDAIKQKIHELTEKAKEMRGDAFVPDFAVSANGNMMLAEMKKKAAYSSVISSAHKAYLENMSKPKITAISPVGETEKPGEFRKKKKATPVGSGFTKGRRKKKKEA